MFMAIVLFLNQKHVKFYIFKAFDADSYKIIREKIKTVRKEEQITKWT